MKNLDLESNDLTQIPATFKELQNANLQFFLNGNFIAKTGDDLNYGIEELVRTFNSKVYTGRQFTFEELQNEVRHLPKNERNAATLNYLNRRILSDSDMSIFETVLLFFTRLFKNFISFIKRLFRLE